MYMLFDLPEGRTLGDIKRVMALLPENSRLKVKVFPRIADRYYRPDLPYQTSEGYLVSLENADLVTVLGLIAPKDNFEFQAGHTSPSSAWRMQNENRSAINQYFAQKEAGDARTI